MTRDDFHKLFKSPGPVVLPVIHVTDNDQAARNVAIAIEEGAAGGFGSHVMQFLAWEGLMDKGLKVRPMTLPDIFQDQDKPELQYAEAGLQAENIVDTVLKALRWNETPVTDGARA